MLDSQRRYELRIRPLGRRAADEYYHQGSIWIEGRNGNTYTVDISNHTDRRALFIVSVDGLDVLKGKPAGPDSEGYVVEANSTLTIPGWKLNNSEAAEFFFSRNDDSYVNSIGGSTSNTGVIGAMVFSERPAVTSVYSQRRDWMLTGTGQAPFNGYPYTTSTGTWGNSIMGHPGNAAMDSWTFDSASVGSNSNEVKTSGRIISQYNLNNVSSASPSATPTSARRVDVNNPHPEVTDNSVFASSPVQQEIGTGFGDVTGWNTITTTFVKANPNNPDTILAVYYNTARNLEKMGIRLKKKKDVTRIANAFPAYEPGCTPPARWKR